MPAARASGSHDADRRALQDDAAQRTQEVARRHDVGDDLQGLRHARDREDESRQHHRRQKRDEQRDLERDLLGFGDRRDQQPGAERADQEQRQRDQQQSHQLPRIGRPNSTIAASTISAAEASEITKYGIVLPT